MEQINNKNKRLTVIVGALLLVIGISFAYFLATTLINGNGASTKITTARINGATIQVDGNIEFEDLNILPGHKNISSVKLTATGNNQTVPYNLIWRGTNGLNTPLNYIVYKTSNEVTSTSTCNQVSGVVNGMSTISESCTISNIDQLGSIIATGTINKSEVETKVVLVQDEMIQATKSGAIIYYYVVLEYPNLDEIQDIDMGGTFEGVVTVEGSTTQADISVVGIYQESEDGSYNKVNEIPSNTSSYTLNSEKSSCTNNAKPIWNVSEWSLEVNNLTQSGTDCNLYFDTPKNVSQIINKYEKSNARSGEITVDTEADDTKLYNVEDDYGTSYVFAGENPNNFLKFANFYWRIIRFNGDGSIRLIYNGLSPALTGESTEIGTSSFNEGWNDNAYLGYMYGTPGSSTYEETHDNINDSTIKKVVDNWYKNNILGTSYENYISTNVGFCGDRTISLTEISDYWSANTKLGYSTNITAYIGNERFPELINHPSLKCTDKSKDLYTVSSANLGNKALTYPIALITADEAALAGGFSETHNYKYYLYTKREYSTMTPGGLHPNGTAADYFIGSEGDVTLGYSVNGNRGVRPVINIRSDVILKGNGTPNYPYIIVD